MCCTKIFFSNKFDYYGQELFSHTTHNCDVQNEHCAIEITSMALCVKNFYSCNLQMFKLRYSSCPWEAFSA